MSVLGPIHPQQIHSLAPGETVGPDVAQKLQAAIISTYQTSLEDYSQIKNHNPAQNLKQQLTSSFLSLSKTINTVNIVKAINLIKAIFSDSSSPLGIDDKLEIYTTAINQFNKCISENKDPIKSQELKTLFDRFVMQSTQGVLKSLSEEDKMHILTKLTPEDGKHLDEQFKLINASLRNDKAILFPQDDSTNPFGLKTNIGAGIALIAAAKDSRMLQHLALLLALDKKVSGLESKCIVKIEFGLITEDVKVDETTVVWGANGANCHNPIVGGDGHAETVKKLVLKYPQKKSSEFLVGINTMGGSVEPPNVTSKAPTGPSPAQQPNTASGPSLAEHVPSKNDDLIEDIFKKSNPQDIITAAQDALTKATNSDDALKVLLQQIIDAHKIEQNLQTSGEFQTYDTGKKVLTVIDEYLKYKRSQQQSKTHGSELTVEKYLQSNPPKLISAVESTPSPTALKNLGNTCFINTALQALKEMKEFVDHIKTLPQDYSIPQNLQPSEKSGKAYVDSQNLISMLGIFFDDTNPNNDNLQNLIAEINKFELLEQYAQDDSSYVIQKLMTLFGYEPLVQTTDVYDMSGNKINSEKLNTTTIMLELNQNTTLQGAVSNLSHRSGSGDSDKVQETSYKCTGTKEFLVQLPSEVDLSQGFFSGNFFNVQQNSGAITFEIGDDKFEVLGIFAHFGRSLEYGHYVYIKHKNGTDVTVYNDENVHNATLSTDKTSYTWTPDGSNFTYTKNFKPQALICRKKVSPHTH